MVVLEPAVLVLFVVAVASPDAAPEATESAEPSDLVSPSH